MSLLTILDFETNIKNKRQNFKLCIIGLNQSLISKINFQIHIFFVIYENILM